MRFDSWKGKEASGWIVQDWQSISPSDLVVDPNIFMNGGFNLMGDGWMQISALLPPDAPILKDVQSEASSFDFNVELNNKTGAVVFVGLNPIKQKSAPPAPNTASLGPVSTPVPAKVPSEKEIARANQIRTFIREHHRKRTKHDIGGVVVDYADRVEYFGKNITRQDFNMQELRLQNDAIETTDTILGEISVNEVSPGKFNAVYTISYRLNTLHGGLVTGICEMHVVVQMSPNGPLIVKQFGNDKKG